MLRSVVLVLFASVSTAQSPKDTERFARWEKDIVALEKKQAEKPPANGGIVFAGSSTIRLWDLASAFPKATNSGFGGSEIRDVTHFADRMILKHEPRVIVFYAGDNDIKSGRSPLQVKQDFEAFVQAVHKRLPKTKVYFISVKPSVARWSLFETQTQANRLVKDYCERDDRLGYIDIVPAMLGTDGKPTPELFVKDGLHLSPKGYAIWNEVVGKAVK
jgi:lysophospholipase L1-like esterase